MKLLLLIASALFIFTACKKEGCTDSLAKNYDNEAEKNDNSCTYETSVIFWINANSSTNFKNNMINSIDLYIDGSKVGQMNTSSDQLVTPECNTVGLTHVMDLGASNSTSITYEIKYMAYSPTGYNEYTYAEGTLQLAGGECNAFLIQ